jgi:hypothetical protein
MIQILYTQDHAARGVALAAAVPGAKHGLVDTAPSAVTGLDTLVFWGHGDQFKPCDRTAAEIVKVISGWKKLNSGLKTVELITCNARHCTGNADSFAVQVKNGLRAGVLSSTRNIQVKALPVTVSGMRNAFSILLAEVPTKSWVYVTGPGTNDSIMMEGVRLINFETVNGKVQSFKGDIALRANKVVRDVPVRKWSMNYGYFNNLRNCLVAV